MKKHIDLKKDLKKIILIFVLSRIPLICFLLTEKNLTFFNIYDVIHYINIAKNGYTKPLQYAFFPLFPILIRTLHIIIPSYELSAILISNLFSFLSIILLYKTLKSQKNKILNISFLIFSPILAFNTIGYTESIYIFLTLLTFYLYRKEKYLLSGITVGLSIITRNSGIILWGAIGLDLLYKLYKKEVSIKNIIIFGLSGIMIGSLYPIYLYIKTNNFLMFYTVQNTYWNKESSNFILSFIKDINYIIKSKNIEYIYLMIQNWGFFTLAAIIAIKAWKKDKISCIYILVSLIAFTTTCRNKNYLDSLPSSSLFRYVLSLFPMYVYLISNKINKLTKAIGILLITISLLNVLLVYLKVFIA